MSALAARIEPLAHGAPATGAATAAVAGVETHCFRIAFDDYRAVFFTQARAPRGRPRLSSFDRATLGSCERRVSSCSRVAAARARSLTRVKGRARVTLGDQSSSWVARVGRVAPPRLVPRGSGGRATLGGRALTPRSRR